MRILSVGFLTLTLFVSCFSEKQSLASSTPKLRHSRRLHHGTVAALAFSADGKTLTSTGDDDVVLLSDARTLKTQRLWCGADGILSADSKFLLDGHNLYDTASGKKIWSHETLPDLVSFECGALSQHGEMMAFCLAGDGGESGDMELWQIYHQHVWQLPYSDFDWGEHIHCAAFSPDTKTVAIGVVSGTLAICNSHNRKTVWYKMARQEPDFGWSDILSLAFSPDGRMLADLEQSYLSKKTRYRIRVYNAHTGKRLCAITGLSYPSQFQPLTSLAFSPSNNTLAGTNQNGITLWNAHNGKPLRHLTLRGSPTATALAWTPHIGVLAAGYSDGTVALWNAG